MNIYKFICVSLCLAVAWSLFLGCESYDYEKKYSKERPVNRTSDENVRKGTGSSRKLDINQVAQSVVQIIARFDDSDLGSSGSGSVIGPNHVLTNYHVINKDGEISGHIEIWFANPDLSKPPQQYLAGSVVKHDVDSDLAIIVTASKIPRNSIEFASDQLPMPGNQLTIIGFPSLGSNTITITQGIVSGFVTSGSIDLIKTDTEINRGNSGGVAVDANNRIVGVPTAVYVDRDLAGRLGLIVPAKYCRKLIRE